MVFLRPAANTRLETTTTLHRRLMVRPSLHELQYSASPRRHDVITKDRTTQPSQRSITAATRKGSAVRTTHRIQSTSQHLTFSRYLNASAPLDWSSSEWFCRGSNLSGMCRCARVSRRSAGTLSVNTTAQLSAVSSATRIYVRLGGQTTSLQYSVACCITRQAYGQELSP